MDEYKEGELIIYQNGDSFEIGKIKRLTDTGAFVWYSSGDTASKTPYDVMHKLINAYTIEETSLGGKQKAASPWRPGTKPPEHEMPVIVQYHTEPMIKHSGPRLEHTGVMSYFACDPEPHWQYQGMGLVVDRWMPIPPVPFDI